MRNIVFGLIMAILTTITAPVAAAPTTPDLDCNKVFAIAEKSAEALIEAKSASQRAYLSARLGRIWKREGVRCALPPIHRFIEGVRAARGERLVAQAMEEVQQLTEGLEALRGTFRGLDAVEALNDKRIAAEEAAEADQEAEAAEAEEEDRKAEVAVAAAKEESARERKMGLMRECYSLTTCVAEIEHLAAEVKKAEKPYDRLPILKAYLAAMARLEAMLK